MAMPRVQTLGVSIKLKGHKMRTGIDVSQRFEYSFPDDVDPKTIFVIKPLTASDRFDMGQFVKDGQMKLSGAVALSTFLIVVEEIRNFTIRKSSGDEIIPSAKTP